MSSPYVIRSKSVSSLTEKEVQECCKLTMGARGEMQRTLIRERRHSKPPFTEMLVGHKSGRAVMLRDKNSKLLAWAFLIYNSGEPFVHVYVHKDFRRQGLGSKLLGHIKRFADSPEYLASGRSQSFFTSLNL
jgi:GNAT superfamily N-acetyltransferase